MELEPSDARRVRRKTSEPRRSCGRSAPSRPKSRRRSWVNTPPMCPRNPPLAPKRHPWPPGNGRSTAYLPCRSACVGPHCRAKGPSTDSSGSALPQICALTSACKIMVLWMMAGSRMSARTWGAHTPAAMMAPSYPCFWRQKELRRIIGQFPRALFFMGNRSSRFPSLPLGFSRLFVHLLIPRSQPPLAGVRLGLGLFLGSRRMFGVPLPRR
jgi:hypothetical protein